MTIDGFTIEPKRVSVMEQGNYTEEQIASVQSYAISLHGLIRHSRSEHIAEKKRELRAELKSLVYWLYQFNINETRLLYRI